MGGIHSRLVVCLVAVAAVISGTIYVMARYVPAAADGRREQAMAGPLVPEELRPHSVGTIVWYDVQGRLVLARDYPELTAVIFDLLRGPVEYTQFRRDTEELAPPSSGCFAVGLEGGDVLLADFLRVMHDQSAMARLRPHLLMLDPAGLDNRSSVLRITPSKELRLKPGDWKLVANRDGATHRLSSADRKRIDGWLSQVAGILMYRNEWVVKEAPAIHGARIRDGWHVAFVQSPQIKLVPVDSWQPFYYLDRTEDVMKAAPLRAVPRRTQALIVTPVTRAVDEAIIVVRESNPEGTAHVSLRLADTKQWINAGIVPLKYP